MNRRPATVLDFRLQLVQHAPLFRGLPAERCGELVRLARERRVVRREPFYEQGDPARDVLVLCAGRVKLTQVVAGRDPVIFRVVVPGEAFGAIDVPDGGAYPTAAHALEPSHALVWDREILESLAARHPVLLGNVVRILSERLRAVEQGWRDVATVRVPQRVAAALSRLAVKVGRAGEGGVVVFLGREDLAQMTGTTAFTVSRLLAEWEARGYLRSRRESVVLLDVAGLCDDLASSSRRTASGGL